MKKTDIVIAHYNEDLNWIDQLNFEYINRVHIYSKGGNANRSHIKLPNIGRESHTYLFHIIDCYDNLSESVIFLQGNPFNHHSTIKPNSVEDINQWLYHLQRHDYTPNFHINQYDAFLYDGKLNEWGGETIKITDYRIDEWIKIYLKSTSKEGKIFWSAQFGIKTKYIKKNKIELYTELYNQHTDKHCEVSHFLERTWGIVFNL